MYNKIKKLIERELNNVVRDLDRAYSLSKVSPLLSRSIKDFTLRKGKRLRPLLFVIGYLGFAKGRAPYLYKTAVSFEFLHDFLLVHDDIVDKADTRRGKPSMHKMFENYLKRFKNIKFNGQDLALIVGDVIYARAIESFLSIKENTGRKEKALRKFINSAIRTGIGEFTELLSGIKNIEKVSRQDIYRIYDYKTASYTFASPLSCGAMLAGADEKQTNKLYKYGIYLGRGFQIKDDISGMFSEEKEIGKSALTDLQEAKKTILIWYAYHNSTKKDKATIRKVLAKNKVKRGDLLKMRKIIRLSGALDYAKGEISNLLRKAQDIIKSSRMHKKYKAFLNNYSQKLLIK
jgi:geranylgeranyl diphosphate synthase type I